jgi:hypothetical protein
MNIQEIRNIAKDYGIAASKLSKVDLVRKIQLAQNHFDCFATALHGECDQMECMWREDCLILPKKQAVASKTTTAAATKKAVAPKTTAAAPKKKAAAPKKKAVAPKKKAAAPKKKVVAPKKKAAATKKKAAAPKKKA